MKEVLTKHSRKPEVKTFDGAEELSFEQRDQPASENRLFNSIIFQLIPLLCGIQRLFQKSADSDRFLAT